MPGRSTHLDNGRARAYVLAVGAGGDCLDICSSLAYHLFFLSPSLWNGWMGNLWFKSFSTEFFLILGRWVSDGWLYAMEFRLRLRRSPPQAGLESGTARSASHQFTELPGLLSGETGGGSISTEILSKTTNHMFQCL